MNEHIQVPLEAIKRAIFALEKFANDTLAGRNAVYELRELLEAVPQPAERPAVCGYAQALSICKRGMEDWKSKSHNKRWWKMIDGTPIPNDLISCIAESFAAEQQPAACRCVDCGGDQPEHDTHCAHMHNLHVPAPEQQAAEFGFTELTEKVAEIELAALERVFYCNEVGFLPESVQQAVSYALAYFHKPGDE